MLKGQQRVKEQSKQEEVTAGDPVRNLTSRQIMAGHVAYTCHIGSFKVFLKWDGKSWKVLNKCVMWSAFRWKESLWPLCWKCAGKGIKAGAQLGVIARSLVSDYVLGTRAEKGQISGVFADGADMVWWRMWSGSEICQEGLQSLGNHMLLIRQVGKRLIIRCEEPGGLVEKKNMTEEDWREDGRRGLQIECRQILDFLGKNEVVWDVGLSKWCTSKC